MQLVFVSASALSRPDALTAARAYLERAAKEASLGSAIVDEAATEAYAALVAPGVLAAGQAAEGPAIPLRRGGLEEAASSATQAGAELVVLTGAPPLTQCDRAVVPEAAEIASLSFEEAAELAGFCGAGLEQSLAGELARLRAEARLLPLGTGSEGATGTTIGDGGTGGPVKALAVQSGVSAISVSGSCLPGKAGIAARLFRAVGAAGVSVLIISQSSSEYSICLCVRQADETSARAAIESEFAPELACGALEPLSVLGGQAILTLVGDGMRRNKGIAGRCFTQLSRADVNIVTIAQGSSERSLSAVVAEADADRALRTSYQGFFDGSMPIDLVLVGIGTVGSAFLAQVRSQAARLSEQGVALRVVAAADSSRMLVDTAGLGLDADAGGRAPDWKARLARDGSPLDRASLLALGPELRNPVLVDCTAGEELPDAYPGFMLAGFHVVTPNKRACSGPLPRYRALKDLARRHRRRFLYETTVGGGLPVIENLQNLLHAGDALESFSGILSGSLSFILGRVDEGLPFSAAVREAMAKGFTEPDPRDDLSGLDVARKVLILAREAGLGLELSDLRLEGLVPEAYLRMSKEEFLTRLEELDEPMERRRAKAADRGGVLRFVGSIDGSGGSVGLEAVPLGHPLAAVKGGENALAFLTRYYSPVPLLLRGYGAGATVTAAGIFADVLRTLNWIREA